jgi:endoglucanase
VKKSARPLVLFALTVAVFVCSTVNVAGAASNWLVHSAAVSAGEAHAQALPSAPAGVSASCAAPTTAKTIKVSWSAVTHATAYTVYDSTTSATGTYSLVASGVSATSWTSSALTSTTNYWFEVATNVGSNWTSAKSSATTESTINGSNPFCVQP